MTINPHIQRAISDYSGMGLEFGPSLSWHSLHGVVLILRDFLCLAYFCHSEDLKSPVPVDHADTVFVSYMAGDMARLKAFSPTGVSNIAFRRGFKNENPPKSYRLDRFLPLIN